ALWLKRHEPAMYHAAGRIVACTDWFMYRLTDAWTLSRNNVTVKWNYDPRQRGWSAPLLRQVGLEDLPGKWPACVTPLGKGDLRLATSAAAELRLRPGLPVAQGGIDAYLGMLGMGAA